MDLIRLPPNALKPGQRLSFSLRDAAGKLLFANGTVLPNSEVVREMLARGAYTQVHETEAYQREMTSRANTLMHQNASLKDIARVQADFQPERNKVVHVNSELAQWLDLQLRVHNLLKDPHGEEFLTRFEDLRHEVLERLARHPDQTLLLLVHDASQEFNQYTARHAILCMALCQLAGERLDWPTDAVRALTRAALSMNLALGLLQDRLAQQREGLSPEQKRLLAGHGDRAADLLMDLGVRDEAWLNTVRLHHDTQPGPLAERAWPERLARLLQRIDVFAARLSPRIARKAQAGAQAARAIFLDEAKQQDEAGAVLIKAVGLYPPGTFVRLANGEECIVIKRGAAATEPLVAALMGKSGNPLTEPVPRDTRLAGHAVTHSLAPHELRLRLSIEKLLRLSL
ncbi:HD-GYP domain-containing protein (c-di-GMP phosphodiesterase class II) [Inhella inkyongensis]|uniref:HD-GYP domain-containing protein (C-di-GMP phosphodiesterase class II) n=1 Tax=Inhella inkyongensis TaxID=392593 RepID=A0A840S7Y8_9BURK|nr:phosphohydrolase [Inhella inkyongensis]MBB5204904.1 HD-GYP domain-containing protein (c-di-GMP phosphodiesterase class II) [Inhella inkyongensis]